MQLLDPRENGSALPRFVFGLGALKSGKLEHWGVITGEGPNNKGYDCWIVMTSNGAERFIRKDTQDKKWIEVTGVNLSEAKAKVEEFLLTRTSNTSRSKPTKSAGFMPSLPSCTTDVSKNEASA